MSLTKPILSPVAAWDVADGQTFTFNVIGGDAVTGNTLYIIDNSTGSVVYTLQTTSFKYEAIVPANASGLTNGTYYSAYITTTNASDETSANSNTIQFYCYSTPSWAFSNFSQGTIVTNSSIAPQVQYSQSEGEALNDYTITLYDSNQLQLSTSGVQYTGSSSSTIAVSYDFFGLEDDTIYYIRAIGHTVENTALDTGFIRFTTDYVRPSTYSILNLENNCDEGYIVYTSLAIGIEGESNPETPTYTEDGIDLTADGSYVTWTDGFEISDNFTAKLWVKNPTVGANLVTMTNTNGQSVIVAYVQDPDDDTKVMATVTVGSYFAYSESITAPASTDELCIQLRRINGVYEIKLGVVA